MHYSTIYTLFATLEFTSYYTILYCIIPCTILLDILHYNSFIHMPRIPQGVSEVLDYVLHRVVRYSMLQDKVLPSGVLHMCM